MLLLLEALVRYHSIVITNAQSVLYTELYYTSIEDTHYTVLHISSRLLLSKHKPYGLNELRNFL